MSPLPLRRFRAERLLRRDFDGLRATVLAAVRARLAAGGGELDMADLEACYAQAWQGLYAATLEGQEIANPTGWLVVVTMRRAIEERRSRRDPAHAAAIDVEERGSDPDLAAQLDDLRTLRQLFEALRARLSARECQAASLCYLQGLSRQEAAERMGVSPQRMRKLMEGDGGARAGVSRKMGELLAVIGGEGWCEEQVSLMRALAFGILDPRGERYRLASAHRRECPACRRYVLSLRGLAAIFPPLFLPAGAGTGASVGAGAGVGMGASAGGGGAGLGGALGGAGASAGGAWSVLAGSVGAKVAGAVGALGLITGGAVLAAGQARPGGDRGALAPAAARAGLGVATLAPGIAAGPLDRSSGHRLTQPGAPRRAGAAGLHPAGAGARRRRGSAGAAAFRSGAAAEFGIERSAAASQAAGASARTATAGPGSAHGPVSSQARRGPPPVTPPAAGEPRFSRAGGGRRSEFSFE